MFHPASLTALLGLGLLAGRVVAAPASTPRSDTSVSISPHYHCLITRPPECLKDFLGELRELRRKRHGYKFGMRVL